MKRTRLLSIVLAMMLLLGSVSCGGNRMPEGVMDEETMVSFLTDAYLLESYYALTTDFHYEELAPDVAKSYDDLFAKHHTSRDNYEKSMNYYTHHNDQYNKICQRVMDNLNEMK